jgi:group I intron endonuclease
MPTCGIYTFTSPSGRVYVGQSIDISRRLIEYKRLKLEKQPPLFRSFLKYGFDNHQFKVIEECDRGELNNREIFWEQYFVSNKIPLLNIKRCGDNGKHSEETCKKISKSRIGIVFSDDHRAKMSEAKKGKKISAETSAKKYTPENRLALSRSLIGHIVTKETRRKIGLSSKGRVQSEETKTKRGEAIRRFYAQKNTTPPIKEG